VTIAIGTEGAAPVLARAIKERPRRTPARVGACAHRQGFAVWPKSFIWLDAL
jgi:hypothetical protein